MKIEIKPLSVNECWQGKRFKTKKYLAYEKEMLLKLKPLPMPPIPYAINIQLGLSSTLADIDNPIKPLLDLIQKKYAINDKDIFELHIEKRIVKKGLEFIDFEIEHYEPIK